MARDQAFCFYYQENLRLMEELGAELVFFQPSFGSGKLSPKAGTGLPCFGGRISGKIFAKELSENRQMLNSVRQAYRRGKQILAECGGFLYLHRLLEGADGKEYELAGLVDASAYRTNRLSRFGYIELEGPDGETIKGHEFHYWETQLEGGDWIARKPLSDRSWRCMVQTDTLLCGFPHLYYPSNEGWLKKMAASGSREEDFAVTEEQEKLEERELTNWLLGRLAKISERTGAGLGPKTL